MPQYANAPAKGKKPGKQPKIFVLDTNIILHDYRAIYKFQENDLVIPIAVIEELDKFKKGNDALSYNARGFMREIDKISEGKLFKKGGIPLGKRLGTIKIEPNHPFPEDLKGLFLDDTQDHRILSTAIWVRANNPGRFVALVTKDINLRMKSKAAGMEAQDYLTDKVAEEKVEGTLREVRIEKSTDSTLLQKLAYGQDSSIPWDAVYDEEPKANQLFKFSWPVGDGNDGVIIGEALPSEDEIETEEEVSAPEASSSEPVLARYDKKKGRICLVRKKEAYGIRPRNAEQTFAIDACLNQDIPLVSITGGAGTGKTLLALAAALELENEYDQIIITRPTVILGNQDIGFLPGDQKTKMTPFLQPLMDNLSVIKAQFRPTSKQALKIDALLNSEKLLISPLAYIRGRSLGKVFFIIDEAQNLTPHEIKTIITRAGEGTKMVFTGDIFQIDQPYLDRWSNGLTHLGEKMGGQPLFEHVFLKKGERSALSEIASKLL